MTYKNYLIYEENGELRITDHIGTIVVDNELIKHLRKELKNEQQIKRNKRINIFKNKVD